MDRPTAIFPLCAHIKSSGAQCNSAALKGLRFCYQHIGGKIPTQRATATTSSPDARLDLAYPDSREAIQHNIHLIAEALTDGKIDTALANTYIRLYRTAELNLHRWERAQEKAKKQVRKQDNNAAEKTQMPSLRSDVIPTEASEAEEPALSSPSKNAGANADEGAGASVGEGEGSPRLEETRGKNSVPPPPQIVIPTEASKASEAEEPALSSPSKNADDKEQNPSVFSEVKPEPGPQQNPTLAPVLHPRDIDWKKYTHIFNEIDRRYSNSPDYVARLKAASQECIAKEQAAHNPNSQKALEKTLDNVAGWKR